MKNALTEDGVREKLLEFDGNMAAVGRFFGVTRQAVFDFCKNRSSLDKINLECREMLKDDIEQALTTKAKIGEAWAVCFYLKTQGRDRGYVENAILHDILREMSELREQVKDAKAANDRRSTSGDGGTEGGSGIAGGQAEAERPADGS